MTMPEDERMVIYMTEEMKRCIEICVVPMTRQRSASTWARKVLAEEIVFLVSQRLARIGVEPEIVTRWVTAQEKEVDYKQCLDLLENESIEVARFILKGYAE